MQSFLDPIVAAAFASLLHESRASDKIKSGNLNGIEEEIFKASTVNDLLTIPNQAKVSRKQALKVPSLHYCVSDIWLTDNYFRLFRYWRNGVL